MPGVTATILQPAPAGRHGDPAGIPNEVLLPGCTVAPAGSTELQELSDIVTSDLDLYGPPGIPVREIDQIRLPEDSPWKGVYDVIGRPQVWTGDPFGDGGSADLDGIVVRLRQVAG